MNEREKKFWDKAAERKGRGMEIGDASIRIVAADGTMKMSKAKVYLSSRGLQAIAKATAKGNA